MPPTTPTTPSFPVQQIMLDVLRRKAVCHWPPPELISELPDIRVLRSLADYRVAPGGDNPTPPIHLDEVASESAPLYDGQTDDAGCGNLSVNRACAAPQEANSYFRNEEFL